MGNIHTVVRFGFWADLNNENNAPYQRNAGEQLVQGKK
jgi:hypothetical protein